MKVPVFAVILVLCSPCAQGESGQRDELPAIPVRTELVCPKVYPGTIHGWHSNRLLKFGGTLYACASLPNPTPDKTFVQPGAFFRREADGTWKQVGTLPYAPYIMCAAPDGRFWVLGSTAFANVHVNRMKVPLDWNSLEEVHTGTNAYMGAGVGPEGNFLVVYTETQEQRAFHPNAVIAAFYDQSVGRWYLSRIATPEGRYGYEGVIVRGRRGFVVFNSTILDPEHAQGGKHSWRHVRLARCEDLTQGLWLKEPRGLKVNSKGLVGIDVPSDLWLNIGWLMPKEGRTGLQDLLVGPDGYAYLAYAHASAPSDAAMRALTVTPHYIARIHPDLAVDTHPTGLTAGSTRMVVDSRGGWHVIGRPGGGDLHIWDMTPEHGFQPRNERVLKGSDRLQAYVIHILRPELFGGEADGDTVHLLSTCSARDAGGKDAGYAQMWHASFNLNHR
jgi:hypothetical protein